MERWSDPPCARAVFHFISQTLLRVHATASILCSMEAVGVSVVAASILRLSVVHQQVRIEVSPDGIRAATGIVAFWMISGLRMAFVSPGNQQETGFFASSMESPHSLLLPWNSPEPQESGRSFLG